MPKLSFSDIYDRNKGQPAFVAGHGPSLNEFSGKMDQISKEMVLFGCNDWYYFYNVAPHFWVLANTMMTVATECGRINRYKDSTILCYADSVDLTDRGWIDASVGAKYLPYDQRHFTSHPCGCGACCRHIIPGRLTIQQELQKYTGHSKMYGCGDTVVLHSIALAILNGCNPIYLAGMDLDYKLGYAKNSGNVATGWIEEFDDTRERIMEHLQVIRESAELKGTRIINLNKAPRYATLETGDLPASPPAVEDHD